MRQDDHAVVQERDAGRARPRSSGDGPFRSLLVLGHGPDLGEGVLDRCLAAPLALGARVNLAAPDAAAAADAAATLAARARALGRPDLVIGSLALGGAPPERLPRLARQLAAELLVLPRPPGGLPRRWACGQPPERLCAALGIPIVAAAGSGPAPYRRVVVAVDLGPEAPDLVALALRMVDRQGATVTVVHAHHLPFSSLLGAPDLRQDQLRESLRRLRVLAASAGPPAGVTVDAAAHDATPETALLAEAVTRRADLVVVGAPPRRGLARLRGRLAPWLSTTIACDLLLGG